MNVPTTLRSIVLISALPLLAGVGLTGCDPTGPDVHEPTFRASWGGSPWEARAGSFFVRSTDSLVVYGSSPVGSVVPHEYLWIRVAFKGTGTYALGPGSAGMERLIGGDVVTATYGITRGLSGTLVIEERTSRRVRGHVVFDTESLREHSPYGPEARFEGEFDAALQRLP
jgi:hypothetical protein